MYLKEYCNLIYPYKSTREQPWFRS